MRVDPLEYDVDELRELRASSTSEPGAGGNLGVSLPYLEQLPTSPETRVFVLDWLTELVDAGGFEGAVAALEYYRFMGWITPEVRDRLEDHLLGVGYEPGGFDQLDRAHHMRSLARIARLAEWAETDPE
ncbi:FlaD/FlaE family flagellar protein [Haloglomus litoreum]|uniref:FlaD/FlaE family flagellar protein n=1 Tax=Haloglomus litoreum TaxID=3034026 RepID=UPI0023E7C5BA|nr:FlaD/FlaE family flagellar protein [Haloglomus sp. DT116]